MFSIKSWPFLAILSKLEKSFLSLPSILFTSSPLFWFLRTDQGYLTPGVCLLAFACLWIGWIKSKYSNKHTAKVEAPCVDFFGAKQIVNSHLKLWRETENYKRRIFKPVWVISQLMRCLWHPKDFIKYYNLTKFRQNWIKNEKFLLLGHFL